ncbi:peptidoglycan-binding domain-containing protein [Microvirga zambiensis]|uniref:peptidoglycan-binding domain-containing protein n=1 Tax=Microvirga zambiensis TaxID=1402137 RepID=UPI00191F0AB8|nr:peptidoglycan-binding domain-containing protein [Microvirga zambiensis]
MQFGVTGIGLAAATIIGWGSFTYSVLSTKSQEHDLRREVSQLRQRIDTVTAERNQQAQANERRILAGEDLNTMLVRIEVATEELQRLNSLKASVDQAIEQARLQFTGASEQSVDFTERPTISTTSSVRLSKREVRAAQEALVDFGYGKLKADGSFGPSTRKAVKAFQRANGLPVSGRLGTATFQALRTHTAAVAQ